MHETLSRGRLERKSSNVNCQLPNKITVVSYQKDFVLIVSHNPLYQYLKWSLLRLLRENVNILTGILCFEGTLLTSILIKLRFWFTLFKLSIEYFYCGGHRLLLSHLCI